MVFGWGSGPLGCFIGYFSSLAGRFLCLKESGRLAHCDQCKVGFGMCCVWCLGFVHFYSSSL